mmetsp:Transcript_3901/g.9181  ORF Transcript_3901/g.9181 Transcript_3901/m.9181 type:complete len:272 (-) Transcript_3901:627-1442(-)
MLGKRRTSISLLGFCGVVGSVSKYVQEKHSQELPRQCCLISARKRHNQHQLEPQRLEEETDRSREERWSQRIQGSDVVALPSAKHEHQCGNHCRGRPDALQDHDLAAAADGQLARDRLFCDVEHGEAQADSLEDQGCRHCTSWHCPLDQRRADDEEIHCLDHLVNADGHAHPSVGVVTLPLGLESSEQLHMPSRECLSCRLKDFLFAETVVTPTDKFVRLGAFHHKLAGRSSLCVAPLARPPNLWLSIRVQLLATLPAGRRSCEGQAKDML